MRIRKRLLRRVNAILSDPRTRATLLTKYDNSPLLGEYDPVTDIKTADWRGPALMVIVHEALHQSYEEWSEGAVEIAEAFLGLTMSNRQAERLWCRIARALER